MKTKKLSPKRSRLHCKTLYTLHYPDDYADNLEKKRNRQMFLKLLQLKKKSDELREQMELLLQKHSLRVDQTQLLISKTQDINDKCIQKTNRRNYFEE